MRQSFLKEQKMLSILVLPLTLSGTGPSYFTMHALIPCCHFPNAGV